MQNEVVINEPFSIITVKVFFLQDEEKVCKMVFILGIPVWKSITPTSFR